MSVYLAIISGAIKLFNSIAARLQQHHDELNGRNAVIAQDNADAAKVNENVAKAAVDTDSSAALKLLRSGKA